MDHLFFFLPQKTNVASFVYIFAGDRLFCSVIFISNINKLKCDWNIHTFYGPFILRAKKGYLGVITMVTKKEVEKLNADVTSASTKECGLAVATPGSVVMGRGFGSLSFLHRCWPGAYLVSSETEGNLDIQIYINK